MKVGYQRVKTDAPSPARPHPERDVEIYAVGQILVIEDKEMREEHRIFLSPGQRGY